MACGSFKEAVSIENETNRNLPIYVGKWEDLRETDERKLRFRHRDILLLRRTQTGIVRAGDWQNAVARYQAQGIKEGGLRSPGRFDPRSLGFGLRLGIV